MPELGEGAGVYLIQAMPESKRLPLPSFFNPKSFHPRKGWKAGGAQMQERLNQQWFVAAKVGNPHNHNFGKAS